MTEAPATPLQFLAFRAGLEEFGVPIQAVREIKGWVPPTRIPNAPPYVRGIINLRGTMAPVYDLRARLGGGSTEVTETHVIMILKAGGRVFGVLVDGVREIFDVVEEDIKTVPEMGCEVNSTYLRGMVTVKDRMVALLALERLFNAEGENKQVA